MTDPAANRRQGGPSAAFPKGEPATADRPPGRDEPHTTGRHLSHPHRQGGGHPGMRPVDDGGDRVRPSTARPAGCESRGVGGDRLLRDLYDPGPSGRPVAQPDRATAKRAPQR